MILFWHRHPALFIGFLLTLGAAFSLHPHFLYPLIALCFIPRRRLTIAALLFALSFAYASYRTPTATLSQPIHGQAILSIDSIKKSRSPFHSSLVYSATVQRLTSESGITIENIPCSFYQQGRTKRLSAATTYQIQGTLQPKEEGRFLFKPDKGAKWLEDSPRLLPLAEWRYQLRQVLQRHLRAHFSSPPVQTFLQALITGDIDEQQLALTFSHLGLQHILCVSGFHFALIALLLRRCLEPFFSPKMVIIILLTLISLYALFLGGSPAALRAWIALSLFFIGKLISRPITPLNALGAGLCIELLMDPRHITHLGFILSFLCTLAILLLYPPCHALIAYLLPKRTFKEVKTMSLLDQHGFILSAFFRQTLAITLAIQLASLPVLLFLFHRFPALSLLYNLFMPLGICLSLWLLCLALLLIPLPGLTPFLHAINAKWTSGLLLLTEQPPAWMNFTLRCNTIPYEGLLIYLTILFWISIRALPTSANHSSST